MLRLNNLVGFGAGGPRGPASVSFIGSSVSTADASVYTFTGVTIGAAGSRKVVVGVFTFGSFASPQTVTIGGVAAILLSEWYTDGMAFYALDTAVGPTADVVVTCTGTESKMSVLIWNVFNGNATVFDAQHLYGTTSEAELTVTAPAGSVGIGMAMYSAGVGISPTTTWTSGLTENYDAVVGETSNNVCLTGASAAFATAGSKVVHASFTAGFAADENRLFVIVL